MKNSIIPGFSITLGFTVFYLSIIIIIPISCLFLKTLSISFDEFVKIITSPRVVAAYKVSFISAFIAAFINSIFGLMIAWSLVRYKIPFRKIIDALIDIPFALPTAVAGIALTSLYASNGFFGKIFAEFGIKIAFTQIGIVIALIFIGLPFVVRSIQPILQDLEKEVEEAASCLGANKWQIFYKIILPYLTPAILTGFAMAFARGLGEYGSVIFIAGNIPKISEIVPVIIVMQLEQYNIAAATSLAIVMLVISFIILFFINMLQLWVNRRSAK